MTEKQNGNRLKLGVLISGSGTNLQAIIDSIGRRELDAEIRIVISNRADAYGLQRARQAGLRVAVIDHRRFPSREAFDRQLVAELDAAGVELVVLAGFMRLLSAVMLQAFPNRIMNIHPALLPAFPGLHVQQAAVDYGVRFAGCTVFFVTEGIDDGPIIIQAVVPVYPDDREESLAARILAQEHRIYPRAIALFAQGRLEVSGRRVLVKGLQAPNQTPALINPPLTGSD
ncbi:MAG TPA: phosphoribosylglycinamide formyltransferase [Candidatus Binataceae bacterium]|jgi:phosphoribosylglycinamide formyltransferase-1